MTAIRGAHLTTFEVAPNGETFSIHLMDEEACPATLVLPTDCLNALIMTLPDVLRRSLLLRYRDDSMRVVYPVGSWEVAGAIIRSCETMFWPAAAEVDRCSRWARSIRSSGVPACPI